MAGTNKAHTNEAPVLIAPAIILVGPQLGENIGMCARAMLNCGVTDLRIVNPRDGWPNPAAVSASSGAVSVIENARLFDSTAAALADLEYVYATTARLREMAKPVVSAEDAGRQIQTRHQQAQKPVCGIMFGPERTGLDNDDVALAHAVLSIPLNPAFSSLNLAQAVLLACYSWLVADNPYQENLSATLAEREASPPATAGMIENFMGQLEHQLEDAGFFRSAGHRPTLMRNIRTYFFRSAPTEQEVRTLHGIIATLAGKRMHRNDPPQK